MRRLEAFWRTRASLIAKASGWLHAEHSRGIWSHLQQVSFIWQTHKHRDPYFQGGFLCFPTKREAKVPGPLSLLGGSGGGSRRSGRRRCAFLQWFPRALCKCPACCSFRQSSTSSQSTSRSHEINVLAPATFRVRSSHVLGSSPFGPLRLGRDGWPSTVGAVIASSTSKSCFLH